jgi:hypothetical protein
LPPVDVPARISAAGDAYLNAHGYNANAKLHFAYAWRHSDTVDDFTDYLCQQHMAKAEAEWFWFFLRKIHD